MKDYIKIARPDHWIKNLFTIPGIVMALVIFGKENLIPSINHIIIGLLATCFIASANYVINEWLDADFDKYHPVKKNRPVVVAGLKVKYILLEYFLLIIIGLTLSFTVNLHFSIIEILLLIMGFLYNVKPFRTKDIPYLDVLSESFNNVIRLLLGWFMINGQFLPPISVMVAYWLCGAYLMNVKRYAEYRMINNKKQAGLYRKSFQFYNEQKLLAISIFYGMAATVTMALFIVRYRLEYIIAIPFIIGLFVYYFMLSFKPDSVVQKPEKLYKEKKLFIYIILICTVLLVLSFVNIPILHKYNVMLQLF